MHVSTLWKLMAGALLAGCIIFAVLLATLLGTVLVRLDIGGPEDADAAYEAKR